VTLSRTQWAALLKDLNPPTYGEIVAELADREVVDDDPDELLKAALEGGTLVEDEDGAFPTFCLAKHDGAADVTDPTISKAGEEPDDDRKASANEESFEDLNTDGEGPCEDVAWSGLQHADPAGSHDYVAWMPARGKKPWNPGAATENQWSWSNPENWTSAERTQEWLDMHPFVDGRAFILQGEGDDNYNGEPDPYLFVDYDDVADGDGTEPAPEAIELMNRLGLTYTDYSTSGTGLHQIFRGEVPNDVRTIQFELPNGAGEVEIYDCKRVCIMTGKHVADTPVDPQPVDEDALEALADEHGKQSAEVDREDWGPDFDRDDLDGMDSTSNIQAIFDAIHQIEPRDIRLKSDLTEEREDGVLSFDPCWARSESGTRLGWDSGFIYRKGDIGLDALQVVALEEKIIRSETDYPRGEDWWTAVDELRDRGAHIPEYQGSTLDDEDLPPLLELAIDRDQDVNAEPTSTLPLKQLDALSPKERRRAARKRGLDWPTTDAARDELFDTIKQIIRHEDDRVVDAPTALGKTHTISTTRWGARGDVTGGRPVVHLLETRDARDEAIEAAAEEGGEFHVLRGRHEACPVAAGNHDPRQVEECDDDRQVVTVDGEPASQVLDRLCEHKGLPFSVAHKWLADHNDQNVELPCGADVCEAITQWDVYRQGPDGDGKSWPLVIATHNFAFAPGLRLETNVVIDEQPDYRAELSTERVRTAVTAYLQTIDAPVSTWEGLVSLSRHDDYGDDAAAEREALDNALRDEPDREWYIENDDAHVLAPALARAVFCAEERGNGRRAGKTVYEPPRLDAAARDDDAWNREWVTVVLDESNDVQQVRTVPDFGAARSVVGLDAHPSLPIWQANTVPWIDSREVLDPEARRLWRRYERGLRVIQVGDATRPLSGDKAEEWLDERRLRVLLEHLREECGADLRTAITTGQVEDRVEALMHEAGINSPELMHYGEEKSRNDFATEAVGLVNGAMDPGDEFVLDLLAELDLDAEVETDVDDDGEEFRARGRGFEGPDAETAAEILASVRENHIAQAAGRYARDPEDPTTTATVFVRTDATPEGFADIQVPGVKWTFTSLQREIVDELRSETAGSTAREISEAVGCSKEHVRQTLKRLESEDVVQAIADVGPDGATMYNDDGTPADGVVDVNEPPTDAYETTNRWSLAIRDPAHRDHGGDPRGDDSTSSVWDWQSTTDGGGPPD
jgi:hypothetical protein